VQLVLCLGLEPQSRDWLTSVHLPWETAIPPMLLAHLQDLLKKVSDMPLVLCDVSAVKLSLMITYLTQQFLLESHPGHFHSCSYSPRAQVQVICP
jgi:hypothetical protein